MSTVTILGTGNMGSALAALVEKGGNTVQSLNSSDIDERVDGDVVILAVPWSAVTEVLSQRRDQQSGKVVIAGDDEVAKGRLSEIVTAAGLRAVDAGSLRRARELEAVAFLEMTLAAAERIPWTGGFALPS